EVGVDCDDTNPNRYPGNTEVCDGIDNDCNGTADPGAAPSGVPTLTLTSRAPRPTTWSRAVSRCCGAPAATSPARAAHRTTCSRTLWPSAERTRRRAG